MRVGAIADDITQTPYLRDLSLVRDVLQHGGKGSEIGMNISNNGVTHPLKTITGFRGDGKGGEVSRLG